MDADLLTELKDVLAKDIYGEPWDKLHRNEASAVDRAAFNAYKTVTSFAKNHAARFEVDVRTAP